MRLPAFLRRRSTLLLIALSFLLGFMTSIAIAIWANHINASIDLSRSSASATAPSGNKWYASVSRGPLRDACNVTLAKSPAQLDNAELELSPITSLPHSAWRAGVRSVAVKTGVNQFFWNLQAYGWPYRCLTGGFANCYPAKRVDLGWWDLPWVKNPGSVSVPARPMWPGIILDPLFFGSGWLLLLAPIALGIGKFRRARRTRRGHCPRCNYDLRGDLPSGCPECGWNREPAPPAHASTR